MRPSIGTGAQDPNGYYIDRTKFTVTDSTARLSISGKFTADDRVAVLPNPTGMVSLAGLTYPPDEGYGSFTTSASPAGP